MPRRSERLGRSQDRHSNLRDVHALKFAPAGRVV